MSKGKIDLKVVCPNEDCGKDIKVKVSWWHYPARWSNWDGGEPEDSGWEPDATIHNCPHCNVVLDAGDELETKFFADLDAAFDNFDWRADEPEPEYKDFPDENDYFNIMNEQ